MALPKLAIGLTQESYSVADDPDQILRAKVAGGPSRQRLDMLGGPVFVDVAMKLEPSEYQYWRAFYRRTLYEGSLPFLIDLIIDQPWLTEYQVKIVPGSHRLNAIQGYAYSVVMQLEARSTPAAQVFDDSLMALFDAYGTDAAYVMNLLEKLVNFDLPRAVP